MERRRRRDCRRGSHISSGLSGGKAVSIGRQHSRRPTVIGKAGLWLLEPVQAGAGRQRLCGPAAELPRIHRIWKRVPARYGGPLFQPGAPGRRGGSGLPDPARYCGAGAGNWISMYAQSDVRTYRTPWFGGTPWQKDAPISVYWDNSPLKDVWKVKTPTIFLVGEKDVRVPMPQSVEMHRALKTNGVETRLYIAPREPHGWGELRHQLFKSNVELEWFETHLKRSYKWEKAPG